MADIITLFNAVLGFLAVIMVFSDELRIAFSLILLALLADGLDGIVARKTGKSKIGEYLEAMADMVSLSIAPMIFIYYFFHETFSNFQYLLIIVLILFLICSIIRLASFHIMKMDKSYVGLPASAATLIILILAFLWFDYLSFLSDLIILVIIIIVSFGMISNVYYPKMGSITYTIAAVLIIITLVFEKFYYGIAPFILLIAILTYSIAGPIYIIAKKTK